MQHPWLLDLGHLSQTHFSISFLDPALCPKHRKTVENICFSRRSCRNSSDVMKTVTQRKLVSKKNQPTNKQQQNPVMLSSLFEE